MLWTSYYAHIHDASAAFILQASLTLLGGGVYFIDYAGYDAVIIMSFSASRLTVNLPLPPHLSFTYRI